MRYLFMFSTLLTLMLSAFTRTKKTNIYEVTANGKKLIIQECTRKTHISNYQFYRFILKGAKPFEVNSLDYEHGLPYKPDVFHSSPVKFFDTTVNYCVIENPEKVFAENSEYLKDKDYPESEKASIKKHMKEEIYKNLKTERKRFILYLNPKDYSLEEFNDMTTIVGMHIKEINQLLFSCKPFYGSRGNYDGWQFCGIVYGNEDDFSEVYTRSKEDFFKVFPDGRIAHHDELPLPGKNWLSGQDYIYTKIKMPGKIIQLKTYTKEDLVNYRNAKGESITKNFLLEQGPPYLRN